MDQADRCTKSQNAPPLLFGLEAGCKQDFKYLGSLQGSFTLLTEQSHSCGKHPVSGSCTFSGLSGRLKER